MENEYIYINNNPTFRVNRQFPKNPIAIVVRCSFPPRRFLVDADEMVDWVCSVQIHPPKISVFGIYSPGTVADPREVESCRIYQEIAVAVVLTWPDLPCPTDCALNPAPGRNKYFILLCFYYRAACIIGIFAFSAYINIILR